MEWNEDYSVAIEEIDDQHKIIIDLINKVDGMTTGEIDMPRLGQVLNELVDYTKSHFAVEESLMRIFKYPDYEAHKEKHDKLVRRVSKLKRQLENGNNMVLGELHYFLTDWLSSHIQHTDMEYAPFMHERGVH